MTKSLLFAAVASLCSSLHSACTPGGQDPWQTGSLVECCPNTVQVKHGGRYTCDAVCTPEGQDPWQTGHLVQCCPNTAQVKHGGRYTCDAGCTPKGQDPYQTHHLVPCCADCTQTQVGDHYICQPGSGPAPGPPPAPGLTLQVLSYNLYWWCVSDEYGNCPQFSNGQGFNMLYDRIKQNGPYDLIGFQECDNVAQIVGGAGLAGRFSYYAAPGDAPMAWDSSKFRQIGGPAQTWVAHDQYGDRFMNWVRLQVIATGKTIFFANTHGPLNGCGDDLGGKYIGAINAGKQPADTVIFTGDFNCGSGTAAILRIASSFENDVTGTSYGGADHIFSSGNVQVLSRVVTNGAPSDHVLIKGVLSVPGSVGMVESNVSMAKPILV